MSPPPFDDLADLKLILEHYSGHLTFQPDTPNGPEELVRPPVIARRPTGSIPARAPQSPGRDAGHPTLGSRQQRCEPQRLPLIHMITGPS
jgi:hypothetical protein